MHLTHAGAALGTLVADNHHIALLELVMLHGLDGLFLGVEDPGRAGVDPHLFTHGALLADRALRRQIALQNSDAALLVQGMLRCGDDVGILRMVVDRVIADRDAVDGHGRHVQELLTQGLDDGRHTARLVKLEHGVLSGRLHIDQVGGGAAGLLKVLRGDFVSEFRRDGRDVEAGVGGAANGHVDAQHVFKVVFLDDVSGTKALPHLLHHSDTGELGLPQFAGVYGVGGGGAGHRQAKSLCKAGHGVSCTQHGAAASGGTNGLLHLLELGLTHAAGGDLGAGLPDLVDGQLLAPVFAGQHGTAGDDHTGDIQTAGRHHGRRYDLVTGGDDDHTVELLGFHR